MDARELPISKRYITRQFKKNIRGNVIRGIVELLTNSYESYKRKDETSSVKSEKFIETLRSYTGSSIGLSALLTTTMVNMEKIVKDIRSEMPDIKILIGGAPVNEEFRVKIGADFYSPDPQGAVEYLNKLIA